MRRLVIAAVLAGLTVVPGAGSAEEAPRATASWTGLGVPYLQFKDGANPYRAPKLRFHDTKVPYSFEYGLLSMAATADSALVVEWAYGGEGKDFEGPVFEVSADGTSGQVERKALGIPLGDPLGHTAYWTKREKRRDRLIAYDTSTHTKIRGPLLRRGSLVMAVDGNTAYVAGSAVEGPASTFSWQPGATAAAVTLPSASEPGEERLLVDISEGRFLSIDTAGEDGPTLLSDAEGNVLVSLPVGFATFSPDGRFLALPTEQRVKVYDVETGTTIVPSLGKQKQSLDSRWTPDGRLVLNVVRRDVWGDYDEGTKVSRFVCTLPDAHCRRLPGVSRLSFEPYLESSAFGQFIAALLPHISRTSKALPPYLRRN